MERPKPTQGIGTWRNGNLRNDDTHPILMKKAVDNSLGWEKGGRRNQLTQNIGAHLESGGGNQKVDLNVIWSERAENKRGSDMGRGRAAR